MLKVIFTVILGCALALAAWAQEPGAAPPAKPQPTAGDLIAQGKRLYQGRKFAPALAKFEAALKLEPTNDEGLGLAAITAFRLDDQAKAREMFRRRAELPEQKPSVKAYSYYRIALTHWRDAHDLVAKDCGLGRQGETVCKLSEKDVSAATLQIASGLDFVQRALAITPNYAEAYNVKNLLHAEAALIAVDEQQVEVERRQSLEALRQALALYRPSAGSAEAANFNIPTFRLGEFTTTKELDAKLDDPLRKLVDGAVPLTRAAAAFPAARAPKVPTDPGDPSATGVTPQGGAYSLGSGRGALSAAYVPGMVKVEVLISTTGNVVFAHILRGRSDLNPAAVAAAKLWKFTAPRFEGKPVQVSGVITFDMRPGAAKPAAPPATDPGAKPVQKVS